jgi:hypothetical protein
LLVNADPVPPRYVHPGFFFTSGNSPRKGKKARGNIVQSFKG